MSVFVHHNTLHAFQHRPFHDALREAHELLGGQPYLTLADYRAAFARGRIGPEDLDAVLERHAPADVGLARGVVSRRALQRLAMLTGLDAETPGGLAYLRHEQGLLERLPADLSAEAAARLQAAGDVGVTLRALWKRAEELSPAPAAPKPAPFRLGQDGTHADGLRRIGREVPLAVSVQTLAIRLAAGFLDLGVAAWPMPGRELGMWAVARRLFEGASIVAPHWAELGKALAEPPAGLDAAEAVEQALAALAVPEEVREAYLRRTLLALPGWFGMFHRLERMPDEGPAGVPVRLVDFVAIVLWIEVSAVRREAARLGLTTGQLAGRYALPQPVRAPGAEATTYPLFRLFTGLGLTPERLVELEPRDGEELLSEMREFAPLARRRLWHEAYEKHHREQQLDAIAALRAEREREGLGDVRRRQPAYQAVFCIDEREESLRRHLEELAPAVETFGTAGFFGLAIRYAGVDEAHPVPLCPVGTTPTHLVREVPIAIELHARRQRHRRLMADLSQKLRIASRGGLRGLLTSVVLGLWEGLTTAFRVGAPRAAGRARATLEGLIERSPTRLEALRNDATSDGYTPAEAAGRLAALLENIGLIGPFAPVVVFVGHGSTSLNNPHESAHDCGACGGRRGAPNARLVAALANDPEVRRELATKGIVIPPTTVFVGGYHDTSSDALPLFDLESLPAASAPAVEGLRALLDDARRLNAHERSRRFGSASVEASPARALEHVEGRADAIAEPRPEYGHCTNAVAVVGRRALTRGLFLDRRSFLISYDPDVDGSGAVLERILAAVGPVGAGISLEYYFSSIDNRRWGSGTKLPHNVTGLLGVMDGHLSDLRTGLPLQMVELHEPVRLLMVVEATPARLLEIAGRQPVVRELVVNRWVQLVSVDPDTGEMQVFDESGFSPYSPRADELPRVQRSGLWYAGRTGHLPPALVLSPSEGRPA